ncbi:radical SAM protein [Thermoplasmatales archaeon ex4484_36]|nr:MAG: radical SAM protein [Thermoplasmatales archaeon ex4484_36]RLF56243.1 MAG: radical SAM protein [Thermoplasmata archaeon]RLF74047.1 MAG: radical SAM protein [Thermoplasmata archaeon]
MTEVVLSTDRTLISNHHGKEFLGFGATGAPVLLPRGVWMYLFAPRMKVDSEGRPWQAPYGMRKIEAALQNAGYDAQIIDPDHLEKHLENAKVLLISHHDYFGFGPPSSTFASIFKMKTVNALSFEEFMEKPEIRAAKKRGLKIIAGGPAAWQWSYREEERKRWGVDTVVEGEGERIVVELVEKALRGEKLPEWVTMPPKEAPLLREIPTIKAPSVNGMVEIMRGCPRGCKFCSVTLRPLRFIPYKNIEKEILVNVRGGVKDGIFQSEDVPLYGAKGVIPNAEKVLKLMRLGKKHYRKLVWSHASIAALVKGERDDKLITRCAEILLDENQSWWGAEIGVETGSPRLAEKIMPAKAKPFDTKEWPSLVVEAAGIMEDTHLTPAMTLITGLPEETEDDIIKTLELVDELWDFKAIIMPMFFVPMGLLKDRDWFKAYKLSEAHVELLKRCLTHGIRQGKRILKDYFDDRWWGTLMIPFYWTFISAIERAARHYGYLSYPQGKEDTEKTPFKSIGESVKIGLHRIRPGAH